MNPRGNRSGIYTDIPGCRLIEYLEYVSSSQVPGLIILHGVFDSSSTYNEIAEQLCAFLSVYLLDRPGRSRSANHGIEFDL
jgi:hypothetical protein